MTWFTHMIRRTPGRTRRAISTLLVVVTAVALVWIGHASAEKGGPGSAAISKTVSQVPTSKGDGLDDIGQLCTVSPQFNDMPGMAKAFKLGGTASRPVIVLFQGVWGNFADGSEVRIRLTIDGVVQSGPGDVIMAGKAPAEPNVTAAHGFNFVSDTLAPGTHTARIQWRDNGAGPGCVFDRSLIILHK